MIDPRHYKKDSPEWVLAKFLGCWKRRAWKQMIMLTQQSWVERQFDPRTVLKFIFNYRLVDAELRQVNARTGAVTVFLMDVKHKYLSDESEEVREVRVFRENKSWKVYPIFTIK